MKNVTADFKETLHKGMIKNFENDGFLTPILIVVKGDAPFITVIPNDMFATSENKTRLTNLIRTISSQPDVTAIGLITEIFIAKMDKDEPMSELVKDGTIKVSELSSSEDAIMMIYSTPSGDDIFIHNVDTETNVVGERLGENDVESISGRFSGFFNWKNN